MNERKNKQLSIKGLAEYMTSTESGKRSILRRCKYPDDDESRAAAGYYRETRDVIIAFHQNHKSLDWIDEQAEAIEKTAMLPSPSRRKQRLRHNARAIRDYAKHFGNKEYDILDDLALELEYGDVKISVVPELHVKEGKKEKVIKLEFNLTKPDDQKMKVISQGMLEAANRHGMALGSGGVFYLDVRRGITIKGARLGARTKKHIEDACRNISAIWDTIDPPRGQRNLPEAMTRR